MNKIITVGRQFGSGGRELGRRLAEELGIEYYDKQIITEIAEHTSLSEEYIKQIVECTPHQLYPITVGQSISYLDTYAFSQVQSVYKAQDKILKDLAQKSSCVIVGRCADYVLRDLKPLRVFVYADLPERIKRCISRADKNEEYTEKELKRYIKQIDKHRAKYYEFYTGQRWGDKANYDLCINTSNLDIKETVKNIANLCK